jgi:hypothetical protein
MHYAYIQAEADAEPIATCETMVRLVAYFSMLAVTSSHFSSSSAVVLQNNVYSRSYFSLQDRC